MYKVPVEEKMLWTVREASEISGLGYNKVYKLMRVHPELGFKNGPRNIMVKREQFTDFIRNGGATDTE